MKFAHTNRSAPQSASALLNSKSFLETLDPEERWKLLNETSTGLKGELVHFLRGYVTTSASKSGS